MPFQSYFPYKKGRILYNAPMTIQHFEELLDCFDYTVRNWLRFDANEGQRNDAIIICAASAFLFDNLFAKKNEGAALTAAAAKEFSSSDAFDPKALPAMATKMRLAMSGDDFEMGKSPLRDYLRWISPTEPSVMTAYADYEGKLALQTAEEITNLLLQENDAHESPMHVAELVFLNVFQLFDSFYKEFYGVAGFREKKSHACFASVIESMENIRKTIAD